jgi:hypothetical protein
MKGLCRLIKTRGERRKDEILYNKTEVEIDKGTVSKFYESKLLYSV